MKRATSEVGTAYLSEEYEFIPYCHCILQILVFCVVLF